MLLATRRKACNALARGARVSVRALAAPAKKEKELHIPIHRLRNIGIIAHIDAGKTTTTERMLYYSGTVGRLTDIDDGDTTMDFMEQERARGITITSAAISFDWREHQINLVDTPGHVDFTVEVERSLRVLDGAVTIIDAVAGVQAQSLTVWKQADAYRIPRIAFINKMDREGASHTRALQTMRDRLGAVPLQLQVPVGEGSQFAGVVDIVTTRVIEWEDEDGDVVVETPLGDYCAQLKPAAAEALRARVTGAREDMVASLADVDEDVEMLFLEDTPAMEVPASLLYSSVARVMREYPGKFTPVLYGASLRNLGVQPLMDAVVRFLPSPEQAPRPAAATPGGGTLEVEPTDDGDLCALAFKVQHDPQRGPLVFIRVYSGTLRAKDLVFNSGKQAKERVNRLLQLHGGSTSEVDYVSAGNIAAAVGLKSAATGDTLLSTSVAKDRRIVLPGITAPAPVFTAALELESAADEDKLGRALDIMLREDPTLHLRTDEETGQLLVSGMGELHLEVLQNRLAQEYDLNVTLGRMLVAYRETVTAQAPGKSHFEQILRGKRLFARAGVLLTPLLDSDGVATDDVVGAARGALEATEQSSLVDSLPQRAPPQRLGQRAQLGPFQFTEAGNVVPYAAVAAPSLPREGSDQWTALTGPHLDALQDALDVACDSGPVAGFPLTGVCLTLDPSQCATDQNTTPAALAQALRLAVREAAKAGSPTLLEPLMRLEVAAREEHLGTVMSNLSAQRRGRIVSVDSPEEAGAAPWTVTAEVPLNEMIGYTTALRSMTSGEGTMSMEFDRYSPVWDSSVLDAILAGDK